MFLSTPVIKMPDTAKPFFVMMDASLTASRGVLMQKDSNGDLHPCAYHSATFSLQKETMTSMIKNSLLSSKL